MSSIHNPVEPGDAKLKVEDDAGDTEHLSSYDEYNWMKEVVGSRCWTDFDNSPLKSFDFGCDGYTASINYGHELLQLTAPDTHCGLVYVRGAFNNNYDAILARAQREFGGKSTFGLKLVTTETNDYKVGQIREQGFLNFRWPYSESVLYNDDSNDGVFSRMSFVKDNTVFQIMRLEPGSRKSATTDEREYADGQTKPGEKVENLSPTMERPSTSQGPPAPEKERKVQIKVGGTMRIGCMCQNRWRPDPAQYIVEKSDHCLSCTNPIYAKSLKIQLFINGAEILMPTTRLDGPEPTADIEALYEREMVLYPGKAYIVVATFSLQDESSTIILPSVSPSTELTRYLGLDKNSSFASDLLWLDRIKLGVDSNSFLDLCTSAACLEQILSVTSVPMNTLPSPKVETISSTASSVHSLGVLPHTTEISIEVSKAPDMQAPIVVESSPSSAPANDESSKHESSGAVEEDQMSPQISREHVPVTGIALLRDIMCYQYVDVQYSFWQVRFLVKAYNFLAETATVVNVERSSGAPDLEREHSSLEEAETLMQVRETYLGKIKNHIHCALNWITTARILTYDVASAAVEPYGLGPRANCHWPGDMIRDSDRTLYPFIIIWYVMKHCAEALPPEFFPLLHTNLERLRSQYSGPTDVGKGEYPTKLIFLMWYSYACLGEIYQHLPEEIQHNNPAPQSVKREIRNIAKAWQKKAESTMASVRKNTTETYSEQEEMIDRLVILGPELGFPSTCVAHTRRRISERRQTTALNPGYVRFHKGVARAPITPPWELSCLNHHARLALWNEPEMDEQDLKTARSDSLQFMTATYTFLPNWDIGFPNIASLWWDIDAAAIMCSTFLDMRTKPASVDKVSAEDDAPKPEFSQKLQPTTLTETEMMSEKEMKSVVEPKPKKDSPDDTIADLLRRQLQKQDIIINCLKKENDMVLEYDWINFSPPYILHPDTWIQSLDDTPELYRSAQTKTVQLRNGILQYFDRKVKSEAGTTLEKDLLAPPEWTVGKIAEQFDLDELLHLTVIDIGFHWNGRTEITITGRLHHQELIDEDGKNNEPQIFTFDGGNHEPNAFGPSPESLTLRLWTTYLDGYLAEDQPVLKGDALQRKYAGLSSKFKELLKNPKTLKEVKEKQRNSLLHVLNDSLLDRAVRYRIFFLQKCSPSVVKAFIYMWHVQAIDTFDNHFRDSSHFFDARKEVWVTSISLSYWGFKQDTKRHGLFHERRDKAPFPPKKVLLQKKVKQRWWRQEHNEVEPTNEIEEGSSSLVISGDVSGNWWTCSIISPVLSETTMMDRIDPIMVNLECFVHQPSTGRCLIFLAFLGIICESLSKEYDAILDEMNRAIKLGRQVLKRGLDWEHEEEAIQRLKSMLWALEALRIFDDRLSDSLDKVREAKESMRKYIIQGPGRRHQELEHQCQIRLEDFDKQYGNLVSVHVKIEQKIVQISRFREGISAVSSLEDTHTALKQNDTIRILTYITIAYLPVSFVAALWSVDLVSENLGGSVFGGLLATFLIATFALAKSLASIMNAWEKSVQKIAKIIDRTKASGDWGVDYSSDDEDLSRKSKIKAVPGLSPTWPMMHRRRRRAMQGQRKGSVSTSEKVNGMLLGD